MARTRTRTKQKRQKDTQQQKTVTIAVSRGTLLMAGGALLALALTVTAGLLLGQRLARPFTQRQSVTQQQAVSPQ
ncbi:MAG: hypothetical protein ACE5F6_08245, partial [Anaerolineae bacterium]